MRPLHVDLIPGQPPAGSPRAFLGADRHGTLYLLRWHEFHGWQALGWEGFGPAATPVCRRLAGEHQGLIVGHVELADAAGRQPAPGFDLEASLRRARAT
jgi:hypothetical protein